MSASLDSAYRMVGPVILGLAIGTYLDRLLSSSPWWMLGLTLLGIVTGFWSIIKQVYYPELSTEEKKFKKPQKPES